MQTRLERLRERLGLERIHLAVKSKVSERTIYNLETIPKEVARPTRETTRRRVAKALGVDSSVLFTLDGRVRH